MVCTENTAQGRESRICMYGLLLSGLLSHEHINFTIYSIHFPPIALSVKCTDDFNPKKNLYPLFITFNKIYISHRGWQTYGDKEKQMTYKNVKALKPVRYETYKRGLDSYLEDFCVYLLSCGTFSVGVLFAHVVT